MQFILIKIRNERDTTVITAGCRIEANFKFIYLPPFYGCGDFPVIKHVTYITCGKEKKDQFLFEPRAVSIRTWRRNSQDLYI